jgi:uncharacterized cysteine cluster protein YcgN (CxxCxxCC family)
MDAAFWKSKTLEQLDQEEWEALCDGCGKCCMVKFRTQETGELFHTDLACPLLDRETIRCTDYPNRNKRVANCVRLTPEIVRQIDWLPESCAYVRVANGDDLEWWHPLVAGNIAAVHEAGVSAYGKIDGASIANG